MTQVAIQVKLLDTDVVADMFVAEDKIKFAKYCIKCNYYMSLPTIYMTGNDNLVEYAELMFDLTNNPSRDDERQVVYGNGRSISTGDIVTVNGIDFFCASFGWEQLT